MLFILLWESFFAAWGWCAAFMEEWEVCLNDIFMPDFLSEMHWYALKVFFNRVLSVERVLSADGVESYVPRESVVVDCGGVGRRIFRPLVPSLLFFRSTERYALGLQSRLVDRVMLYTCLDGLGRRRPAAISDAEMSSFMLVVSSGDPGLEYIGGGSCVYRPGQRVRVTGGVFRGAEGYIRRIRHNRRLTVTLHGVCTVATSFIDPRFLERVE